MENTLKRITDLNKSADEISMQDIVSFIQGNTNPIEEVLQSIQLFLSNVTVEKIGKENKSNYKLSYNNSCIYCGSHYNPFPNIKCYVL